MKQIRGEQIRGEADPGAVRCQMKVSDGCSALLSSPLLCSWSPLFCSASRGLVRTARNQTRAKADPQRVSAIMQAEQGSGRRVGLELLWSCFWMCSGGALELLWNKNETDAGCSPVQTGKIHWLRRQLDQVGAACHQVASCLRGAGPAVDLRAVTLAPRPPSCGYGEFHSPLVHFHVVQSPSASTSLPSSDTC